MKVIVSEQQLNDLNIPKEDIEFVKVWKEKTGHYPKFRELQQSGKYENDKLISTKVGDILPNHPNNDITLKTYVDLYLGKYLKPIIAILSSDEPFTRGNLGSRNYVTIDKKQILRSELEALTYNIFVLENVANEIEVDSKKFKKSCGGKEPDFVWERKKIIIEVAGMEDEQYKSKLANAKNCFESLGYKVYIIDARPFEKQGKYISYYRFLCELLGFEPKDDVIQNPYKYLGYNDIDKEFKQKYIDDTINKIPLTRKEDYTLGKYIKQLYGYGIKEYKKRNELKRFRNSIDKNEIKKYKSENPQLTNKEIAKHFGVGKNLVQGITKKT